MNINRLKKEKQIGEIKDIFKKYDSFYLLDFVKMSVLQSVELRRKLRENSFSIMVVKNRLALRALDKEFPEEIKQFFRGSTAIAFASGDSISLARLIRDFSLQHRVLSVKGGLIEGQFFPKERFYEISNLGSREDLLAKIGFLMACPLTKLIRTWQAPFNSVSSMLSQLKSKK